MKPVRTQRQRTRPARPRAVGGSRDRHCRRPHLAGRAGTAQDTRATHPMPIIDDPRCARLDAELAAERTHLHRVPGRAGAGCASRAAALFSTGANVAGDAYSAETLGRTLSRRVAELADDPTTPLFFGRLDIDETAYHIGRRHVTDDAGEPMVLDWRAPLSRSFYRASVARPAGVAARRRFGFVKGELTSFEDEHLDRGEELGTSSRDPDRRDRAAPRRADARHRRHHPARAGRAGPRRPRGLDLRAGRARHRQDRGRPAPGRVPALSAPRAAAPLRRADRRAEHARSCRYISAVLPALGEVEVQQSTVDDLIARVPVRGRDSPRRPRCSSTTPRMAAVLRQALWTRLRQADRADHRCRTARTGGGSIAGAAAPHRRRGPPRRTAVRGRPGAGPGPGGRRCCSASRSTARGNSPGEGWLRQMSKVAPVTDVPRRRLAGGDPGVAGGGRC